MSKQLAPALVCLALVFAAPALAQDDAPDTSFDDIPHITIVGSAHEEVAPDLATVSLGVVIERPTASAATDEVAQQAQAVVASAKGLGVAAADIQTQALTLSQTYDEVQDASGHYTGQKPRGFEAGTSVRIRIRDLAKAGTIAQTLIQKGANRFDGIDFSVEHPEPVQVRLTAAAIRNAKAQAQSAADAAGVKLGRVLQIEHPSAGSPVVPMVFATRMMKAASAPAAMPVEAGTSTASAEMEVTWAIAPN